MCGFSRAEIIKCVHRSLTKKMTAHTPTILGISGKIGAGKTTLASELKKSLGTRAIEINFGDELKKEVASTYAVPLSRFYDQAEKNKPISAEVSMTLGEALQKVGTERREQDANYWVEKLAAFVDTLRDFDLIIVADLRLKNEARWLKEHGAVIVRLNGDPGAVRLNSTRDLQHVSEVDLDDYERFDFVFDTEKASPQEIRKIVFDALEK